jgi:excisionase family DNA binding protein
MNNNDKDIMSVIEVARYLGFSQTKIYRLLKTGSIPAAKVGGQYRFARTAIDHWIGSEATLQPSRDELAPVSAEADALTRNLLFVGLLTREVSKAGNRPIIVGGQAVEFYTAGGYATRDIDLVAPDAAGVGRVLDRWGFRKTGRFWVREDLGLAVEVPGSVLAGDAERVTEVEIEGLKVYLIGIEDIIVDRLNAFVHWSSSDDGAWAREMSLLNSGDIDWEYLEKRAEAEGVLEAARSLRGKAGKDEKA